MQSQLLEYYEKEYTDWFVDHFGSNAEPIFFLELVEAYDKDYARVKLALDDTTFIELSCPLREGVPYSIKSITYPWVPTLNRILQKYIGKIIYGHVLHLIHFCYLSNSPFKSDLEKQYFEATYKFIGEDWSHVLESKMESIINKAAFTPALPIIFKDPVRILAGDVILINSMAKFAVVEPINNNLYELIVKFYNFSVGSQIYQDLSKHNLTFVEMKMTFHKAGYPFYPPTADILHPRLKGVDGSSYLSLRITEPLHFDFWDPSLPLLGYLKDIYGLIQQYARLDEEVYGEADANLERGLLHLEKHFDRRPDSRFANFPTIPTPINSCKKSAKNFTLKPKKSSPTKGWAKGIGYGTNEYLNYTMPARSDTFKQTRQKLIHEKSLLSGQSVQPPPDMVASSSGSALLIDQDYPTAQAFSYPNFHVTYRALTLPNTEPQPAMAPQDVKIRHPVPFSPRCPTATSSAVPQLAPSPAGHKKKQLYAYCKAHILRHHLNHPSTPAMPSSPSSLQFLMSQHQIIIPKQISKPHFTSDVKKIGPFTEEADENCPDKKKAEVKKVKNALSSATKLSDIINTSPSSSSQPQTSSMDADELLDELSTQMEVVASSAKSPAQLMNDHLELSSPSLSPYSEFQASLMMDKLQDDMESASSSTGFGYIDVDAKQSDKSSIEAKLVPAGLLNDVWENDPTFEMDFLMPNFSSYAYSEAKETGKKLSDYMFEYSISKNKTTRITWSKEAYLQAKNIRKDQSLLALREVYFASRNEMPPNAARLIKDSILLPFLEEHLCGVTLLEAFVKSEVYLTCIALITNLVANPEILLQVLDYKNGLFLFYIRNVAPEAANGLQLLENTAKTNASISLFSISIPEQINRGIINLHQLLSNEVKSSAEVVEEEPAPEEMIQSPESLDLGGRYKLWMKPLQFESCAIMVPDAKIAISGPQVLRISHELKALAQDSLPLDIRSSIFVRSNENNLATLKAMITGPEDTPYANGCYFFDFVYPESYPQQPPKVVFVNRACGHQRINPNLYNTGYICLSLLGTWHGDKQEQWSPSSSTTLQVLISIQSMIFTSQPYFNEPGYERHLNTQQGDELSKKYNQNVYLHTIEKAMLAILRNPPSHFAEVVRRHFYLKKDIILEQTEKWVREVSSNQITQLYNKLKEELSKLTPPDGVL